MNYIALLFSSIFCHTMKIRPLKMRRTWANCPPRPTLIQEDGKVKKTLHRRSIKTYFSMQSGAGDGKTVSGRNWKGRSRFHCLWWKQQREMLISSYVSGSLTGFFCPKYKLFILISLSFCRGCEIRSDVLSKKCSYYRALPDKLPGQSKACTSNQDMHSSFSKAFRGIKLKIWY